VSLKEARDRRDAARKLLADGIDPSENRDLIERPDSLSGENPIPAQEVGEEGHGFL
jgi:hypothetical protein